MKTKFWDNRKANLFSRKHIPINKYWFHDDVLKSAFFDSNSIAIPIAEEYIVKLLNHVTPNIKDQKLLKRKELLAEEESAHALVHTSYNRMLEQEGYRVKHYRESLVRLRGRAERHLSQKWQLAFCASLEHLTACTGLIILEKGVIETGVDERMRKVWLWHSLEEMDHRDIMFDIYKYFGGGYLRRVAMMMFLATLVLWEQFKIRNGLLWQSGHFFDWGVRKNSWKFLWGKNGFHRHMAEELLKWMHPNFHPLQIKYQKALEYRIHRYPIEEELASYFPA